MPDPTDKTPDASPPDPTPEAAEIRLLDPTMLRFARCEARLRLTVDGERSVLQARVMRAFPLSHRDEYLSVRDGANKEVGVIRRLTDLDPENREIVETELARRYVLPVIQRVVEVKERFGVEEWRVETDHGPCTFTTRNLNDSIVRPEPGRVILTDVEDNRFEIRDMAALDAQSQQQVLPFL